MRSNSRAVIDTLVDNITTDIDPDEQIAAVFIVTVKGGNRNFIQLAAYHAIAKQLDTEMGRRVILDVVSDVAKKDEHFGKFNTDETLN